MTVGNPGGDDFSGLGGGGKGKGKRAADEMGSERVWLKCYETMPPQFLNAYGEGCWNRKGDAALWECVSQAMKTGAKYMTEFASDEPERRGIAANRWLQVVLNYVKYQQEPAVKEKNERTLDPRRLVMSGFVGAGRVALGGPAQVCRDGRTALEGGGWAVCRGGRDAEEEVFCGLNCATRSTMRSRSISRRWSFV